MIALSESYLFSECVINYTIVTGVEYFTFKNKKRERESIATSSKS